MSGNSKQRRVEDRRILRLTGVKRMPSKPVSGVARFFLNGVPILGNAEVKLPPVSRDELQALSDALSAGTFRMPAMKFDPALKIEPLPMHWIHDSAIFDLNRIPWFDSWIRKHGVHLFTEPDPGDAAVVAALATVGGEEALLSLNASAQENGAWEATTDYAELEFQKRILEKSAQWAEA